MYAIPADNFFFPNGAFAYNKSREETDKATLNFIPVAKPNTLVIDK